MKIKLIMHEGVMQPEFSASFNPNPLILKYSQVWLNTSWAMSWDGTGQKPLHFRRFSLQDKLQNQPDQENL